MPLRRVGLLAAVVLASATTALTSAQADPPPLTVTITVKPPSFSASSDATFEFTSDPNVTFECVLDSTNADSSCSTGKAYSGLADGPHVFEVHATDKTGNSGTASYSWTIDTSAPTATISAGPAALTNSATATFSFTSNESDTTFQCALDDAGYGPCVSPETYLVVADGAHTFKVKATDQAGNTGSATTVTWTIDTTAPTATIGAHPSSLASSATASFEFASSEAGSSFQCALDDAIYEPCASPQTYERLTEGAHTFRVESTDPAGNTGPPAAYGWVVDTTPPATVVGLRAQTGYRYVTLSWQPSTAGDFDHVAVLEEAGTSSTAAVYKGAADKLSARITHDRAYAFSVVAYDRAGNASPAAVLSVRPSALMIGPRDGVRVGAPPLLAWLKLPAAKFYNVQLYRNGRKILTSWPRGSHLQLRARWASGHAPYALHPGRYHWYVWPAFGKRTNPRYGPLLGTSSFVVR